MKLNCIQPSPLWISAEKLSWVQESFGPKEADVSVCIVDRQQTIEVLKESRDRRLECMAAVIG